MYEPSHNVLKWVLAATMRRLDGELAAVLDRHRAAVGEDERNDLGKSCCPREPLENPG